MVSKNGGIVLLHKEAGPSSAQVLNQLKKKLPKIKIGHAGTLDPFASGLLIVMLGKATKLNFLLMGLDKEYRALMEFGKETDSLDPEGEIIAEAALPREELVAEKLKQFLGEQDQLPPAYSALKVDGKRAYALARAGEKVELAKRKIKIHQLEIHSCVIPDLDFSLRCSKGTYVRSLARDIGLACNSRAYLQKLCRTAIGPFGLEDAVKVLDFQAQNNIIPLEKLITYFPDLNKVAIKNNYQEELAYGRMLRRSYFKEAIKSGLFVCLSEEDEFLALLEMIEGEIRYRFVC